MLSFISTPDSILYLLWNGNLAIAESDVRYALIIWIKPFHQGISQGVLFNDYKDLNTQIMLSSSKKAEDQEDQWIVDENSTILTTIFEKANNQGQTHYTGIHLYLCKFLLQILLFQGSLSEIRYMVYNSRSTKINYSNRTK